MKLQYAVSARLLLDTSTIEAANVPTNWMPVAEIPESLHEALMRVFEASGLSSAVDVPGLATTLEPNDPPSPLAPIAELAPGSSGRVGWTRFSMAAGIVLAIARILGKSLLRYGRLTSGR